MATTVPKVQGDSAFDLVMALTGANNQVQDLTGASVKFQMWNARTNVVKINAVATVDSPATAGVVRYAFGAADLDTAGVYHAEWKVTFANGKPGTFPEPEPIVVVIRKNIAD